MAEDKFSLVKNLVSPQDIAIKYLGNPIKKTGDKLWYSSPFRSDSTPSMVADSKRLL